MKRTAAATLSDISIITFTHEAAITHNFGANIAGNLRLKLFVFGQ
jgi:hypothetical protein